MKKKESSGSMAVFTAPLLLALGILSAVSLGLTKKSMVSESGRARGWQRMFCVGYCFGTSRSFILRPVILAVCSTFESSCKFSVICSRIV